MPLLSLCIMPRLFLFALLLVVRISSATARASSQSRTVGNANAFDAPVRTHILARRTYDSFLLPECSPCWDSESCATRYCEYGVCLYSGSRHFRSRAKCQMKLMRDGKRAECSDCKISQQCSEGMKCVRRRCVKNRQSIPKCFPRVRDDEEKSPHRHHRPHRRRRRRRRERNRWDEGRHRHENSSYERRRRRRRRRHKLVENLFYY